MTVFPFTSLTSQHFLSPLFFSALHCVTQRSSSLLCSDSETRYSFGFSPLSPFSFYVSSLLFFLLYSTPFAFLPSPPSDLLEISLYSIFFNQDPTFICFTHHHHFHLPASAHFVCPTTPSYLSKIMHYLVGWVNLTRSLTFCSSSNSKTRPFWLFQENKINWISDFFYYF